MKIITIEELKSPFTIGPFFKITDPNKEGQHDDRAVGCGQLALLNLTILMKRSLGLPCKAWEDFCLIQKMAPSKGTSVSADDLMAYFDNHPILYSSRIVYLTPYASYSPEGFLTAVLSHLLKGLPLFVMMEVPTVLGEEAKHSANHASVIYSEEGKVFFDSLEIDLEFLVNALYYSRACLVLACLPNPRALHE